jgi:hypothetical protein
VFTFRILSSSSSIFLDDDIHMIASRSIGLYIWSVQSYLVYTLRRLSVIITQTLFFPFSRSEPLSQGSHRSPVYKHVRDFITFDGNQANDVHRAPLYAI